MKKTATPETNKVFNILAWRHIFIVLMFKSQILCLTPTENIEAAGHVVTYAIVLDAWMLTIKNSQALWHMPVKTTIVYKVNSRTTIATLQKLVLKNKSKKFSLKNKVIYQLKQTMNKERKSWLSIVFQNHNKRSLKKFVILQKVHILLNSSI